MTIEHDLLGLPFEAHLYNILHELYIPSSLLSHWTKSVLHFTFSPLPVTTFLTSPLMVGFNLHQNKIK